MITRLKFASFYYAGWVVTFGIDRPYTRRFETREEAEAFTVGWNTEVLAAARAEGDRA